MQKIETPNDRLHSGLEKSNGLYFDAEVGLGRKSAKPFFKPVLARPSRVGFQSRRQTVNGLISLFGFSIQKPNG
ncbi:hypothetical protein QYZ38_15510 [Vibrio parahaemolyticus]|nr:hypothetical protein [Vibrio parahaemolyticus]